MLSLLSLLSVMRLLCCCSCCDAAVVEVMVGVDELVDPILLPLELLI